MMSGKSYFFELDALLSIGRSFPAKNTHSRNGISYSGFYTISLLKSEPTSVLICWLQNATPFTVFTLALSVWITQHHG